MSIRLKGIIALMSLALLGLIFIQFYWIDNAITLKEDEFHQKVHHAMVKVVQQLERKEAFEKFKQHQLGRQLLHKKMMRKRLEMIQKQRLLYNAGVSSNPDSKRYADHRGRVIITEKQSGDSNTRIITREIFGDNFNHASVEIDYGRGKRKMIEKHQDNLVTWTNADTAFESQMDQKTAVLDDIFFELIQSEKFTKIEDRVNERVVDSLLNMELKDVMIQTDVKFSVLDHFGRTIPTLQQENETLDFRNSIYQARLFPNDLFTEPFYLSLIFPNQKSYLLQNMWVTLCVSTLFILLIIGAFWYTIHVIQNQKQLSIIKNDFINNMTHELKTPISTISLACEALSDDQISVDSTTKGKFLKMISHENSRLATLVENVLKSSIWDKTDFEFKFQEIDVHALIRHVAETVEIQLQKKDGKLELQLNANNFTINGDPVHFTNAINNLIDNAIKYSKERPSIIVKTCNVNENLKIEVTDKGIGISKEHQKKIFEKFYRVPTGNVHDVKGFGLGLNYVLNVIKNHNGIIEVQSQLDRGSTFTISVPGLI